MAEFCRNLPITIRGGVIGGKVIEKIFFGNSGDQIASFWGLENLRALEKVDKITLPNDAFEYITNTFGASKEDLRERGALFGWNDNSLDISNEVVSQGSLSDFVNIGRIKHVELSLPFYPGDLIFKEMYFGASNPIKFHTHPNFETDKISELIISSRRFGRREIDIEKVVEHSRFEAGTFSDGDITSAVVFRRLHNSSLITSSERHLYIVPTELMMRIGLSIYQRSSRQYGEGLSNFFEAVMYYNFGLDPSEMILSGKNVTRSDRIFCNKIEEIIGIIRSSGDIYEMRDNFLIDLCNQIGYVVFASDSPKNPTLFRLS